MSTHTPFRCIVLHVTYKILRVQRFVVSFHLGRKKLINDVITIAIYLILHTSNEYIQRKMKNKKQEQNSYVHTNAIMSSVELLLSCNDD